MVIYSSSPHHGLSPQRFQGCENNMVCEGGGTGRRARLRCVWFILGGSSPLPRTKNQYTSCAGFSFCAREGISNKAAAFMPQAISPVQQRRPQPAAETGRSCWGRVLIFQSPAKGLRKNQQTQPVQAPAVRFRQGSQRIGMSTKKDAARLIRVGSFCFGGRYRTRTGTSKGRVSPSWGYPAF